MEDYGTMGGHTLPPSRPGFADVFEMMDKTSTLKAWGQSE
jgi:hypothetical protein